ncbi:fungal-specific transcription factor domain-containing protein [Bombardia bombarda]|uniref:Fungal-specific transcription factor domain-containing protein n=1 Tax=Bombardia bombarda TaxID=252184 RepID=A0AA40CHF1_9PEZI|nr:fungal-specific transcription factor domain-containing protein [Bombardia bombarda]
MTRNLHARGLAQACVDIEDGTCQYCRTAGIPCEVDLRSRKQPFYRVLGEVYEHSIKLLRLFVPEEELPELMVENIQALLDKLKSGTGTAPQTLPGGHAALTAGGGETAPAPAPAAGVVADAAAAAAGRSSNDMMEADQHPLLQEELGCMLLDSMDKYRYVGADSSIRWNHAVHFTIIPPLKIGLLPPTTPENDNSKRSGGGCPGNRNNNILRDEPMYMPLRQLRMAYAARFFDQIHCLSSSWLCAMYSVFAMGSTRPRDEVSADTKTSLDYLSMAQELSTAAADEADMDSIKAFGLLSLAAHATCYSVTAYLLLGTAVRIGFSLGLHRDVSPRSKDSLERERCRRLWWTIYTLDHEMASRFGYPCSIVDDAVFMRAPPATEQILNPGPNTPLSF